LGYRGKIVSFEPLTTAHASLTRNASRDDLWRIAERTALGAENGMIDMHVSGNSVSSSVLNMLQSHSNAAPASAYVKSESAPIKKLDDLSVITSSDRTLLKIDVQGFESEVLRGAEDTLELCHAVILEMSLIPLYEGQASALWLWNYLVDKGFEPWSLEPGFRNPSSQRMLQCDGYFIRHKSA
jgi:FkbM family methyltransferase